MAESPRELPLKLEKVETTLPFTFRHRPVDKPKLLVLFLHGYSDHGGSFLKRLFQDQWPESFARAAVLAPNGPFPVPVKSETGWREAYAWYFYDEKAGEMMISPETAVRGCEQLIQKFGYEQIPKVIVGFSQGGFLAPHLATHLNGVREIIGIATGFREAYYPLSSEAPAISEVTPWTVTGIQGSDDEVFPLAETRAAHAALLRRGYSGEFVEIPKLTHVASPEVGSVVADRIQTWI